MPYWIKCLDCNLIVLEEDDPLCPDCLTRRKAFAEIERAHKEHLKSAKPKGDE